jgi:predicted nuclease of predicted toxin-antitoxin system
VVWIREASPGSLDSQVLARAQDENRIMITFDKDFGELAFRYGLPASCGIVLFRISTPSSEYIARLAVAAFNQREDWAGHFSVIEDTRIRMSSLPISKG